MKQIVLEDWREDCPDLIEAKTLLTSDRFEMIFEDDRSIWVELEDGIVRVHCYCKDSDEPVNIDIGVHQIKVDTKEYEQKRIEGYE